MKQEDEMSSNESLVELTNNINEDWDVSKKRLISFPRKSKIKCSQCDVEFLWKRDLTFHQMTNHKSKISHFRKKSGICLYLIQNEGLMYVHHFYM